MDELPTSGTDGPFFDSLEVGIQFNDAPAIELSSGFGAVHHAIVGGRLRMALDSRLARLVCGSSPLAHPALVWDVSIGQSTLVTQRAIANLFYRGLAFLRAPFIGDTLQTRTTITGLRPLTPKPGRPPRGLAIMHILTMDQNGQPILDYHRCAMLPSRHEDTRGPCGVVDPPAPDFSPARLASMTLGWNLGAFRSTVSGPHFAELRKGTAYRVAGGDLVSGAPELARLTLNLAAVHHDRTLVADGRRLVYGGHTIGLALAQVTRALPSLVTVIAWQSCDHIGPVHENDTLHSIISIEHLDPLADGGLAHLRVMVQRTDEAGSCADVLDWRMVGLFA